jgi:antitoxin component of MazEF toxin-antitoxin module
MTVMVKQLGGSVAVVIPKAVAREMRLTDGTPLDISTSAGAIIMRKPGRRARRPLSSIIDQIDPAAYKRRKKEMAEKYPVGREIW